MTREKEKRNVRDSVFVDLFYSDITAKENILSLYNALHDEPLPPDVAIEKIKIDDVLYTNFKNDVSFEIGDKIFVFGEHQSTVNENMPLRCLLYAGRAYEQILDDDNRYRRSRIPIPKPEFYTFYNGSEERPGEETMKLSDAFIVSDEAPALELVVKVININSRAGHQILERCEVLREYTIFMEKIKHYRESGIPDAIKRAIYECEAEGILTEYLKRRGSEVMNMLTAEYNYEKDMAVQRQEAIQLGIQQGVQQGVQQGATQKEMEIAMKLMALGQSDTFIAEATGLSQSEILKLHEKRKTMAN